MKLTFPNKKTGIWRQFNQGEIFGDAWASFNLDLRSNLGKIRVAPRTKKITTSDDVATLISPVAFVRTVARSSDEWFALCNQRLLTSNGNTDPTTAYIVDGTGSSPTTALSSLYSDMVEFNLCLITSLLTNIAKLTAGTWDATWWTGTLGQSALTTGIPHPVHVAFNNLLLIGDGNKLHTVDISANVDTGGASGARLTLRTDLQIVWIRSTRSKIFIGCRNTKNRSAEIIEWDGTSVNFNDNYRIGSSECYACVIKNDVAYAVNGWGQLLEYNGGGFTVIDNFPIMNSKYYLWGSAMTTPPIHRNGMCLIDNEINILMNAGAYDNLSLIENMVSGIWEYTKDTGLYHKYGLNNGQTTCYGSPVVLDVGALVETSKVYGNFLAGAKLYKDDSSTQINLIMNLDIVSGGNITDNSLKVGYIVSPQIQSAEIEEVWDKIWLQYTKFLNSTDKIVTKYRIDKKNYGSNIYKFATWVTTTTFTVNVSQTFSDVTIGDEVEILSGLGAGLSTKITNITGPSGSLYTVTIADAVPSAANGLLIRIGNWTEIATIQDLVSRFTRISISDKSNWVQFKHAIFSTASTPEIEKIKLNSNPKTII